MWFTVWAACLIWSLDRNHLVGSSNGAPLSRPILVSLSKYLAQEVGELVALQAHPDGFFLHRRVPVLRGIVGKAQQPFKGIVVADEMQLIVEDELFGQ
jgi:hypothetical protein